MGRERNQRADYGDDNQITLVLEPRSFHSEKNSRLIFIEKIPPSILFCSALYSIGLAWPYFGWDYFS